MYYTYVLYSAKYNKIYIGQSNNINIRLECHNNGKVRSTKNHIPWVILYYEIFETRTDAMKREKELKSHKGRDFIRELVRVRQLPD